jgi:tRNA (cytidine/uridine-2'-O-)-methyltransferase
VQRHADWPTFLATQQPEPSRLFTLTTRGTRSPFEVTFKPGDYLVFGSETKGISDAVRASFGPGQSLRLPMREGQRSLNLSNAVAVTVFEAWRQNGFAN